jgi:hypothetical protein
VWLSFATAASAHALWLELEATGFQLQYGENLRESSPGLLDRIDPPPAARAYAASGDQALKVEKRATSFQIMPQSVNNGREAMSRSAAGERLCVRPAASRRAT